MDFRLGFPGRYQEMSWSGEAEAHASGINEDYINFYLLLSCSSARCSGFPQSKRRFYAFPDTFPIISSTPVSCCFPLQIPRRTWTWLKIFGGVNLGPNKRGSRGRYWEGEIDKTIASALKMCRDLTCNVDKNNCSMICTQLNAQFYLHSTVPLTLWGFLVRQFPSLCWAIKRRQSR